MTCPACHEPCRGNPWTSTWRSVDRAIFRGPYRDVPLGSPWCLPSAVAWQWLGQVVGSHEVPSYVVAFRVTARGIALVMPRTRQIMDVPPDPAVKQKLHNENPDKTNAVGPTRWQEPPKHGEGSN